MVPCLRRKRQKNCLLFLLACMTLSFMLQFLNDYYQDNIDSDLLPDSRDTDSVSQPDPTVDTRRLSLHEPLSVNPRVKAIPWNFANAINFGVQENYFHPIKNLSNPVHVKFLIPGTHICQGIPPYLLVVVPTLPGNQKTRDDIRGTWASIAKTQTWPLRIVNAKVKVVFLLGQNTSSEEFEKISEENKKNQDMVMADFVDSYRNLSRKILTGLTWIKSFCSDARFILKCDEDTFVNVPLILDFLLVFEHQINFTVIGYIYGKSRVLRTGRWKVESSEYPINYYPVYTSGNAYILSRDLALRVLQLSKYMPYVPVEDAYITGILARVAGGRHINSKFFTYLGDKRPNSCDFLADKRLAWTRASAQYKYKIWKAFENNRC